MVDGRYSCITLAHDRFAKSTFAFELHDAALDIEFALDGCLGDATAMCSLEDGSFSTFELHDAALDIEFALEGDLGDATAMRSREDGPWPIWLHL